MSSLSLDYELHSKNFLKQVEDTVNNLQLQYPLQPASGTDMENMMPLQLIVVVVPNIKNIVLKEMQWMIDEKPAKPDIWHCLDFDHTGSTLLDGEIAYFSAY